jgi:uncharacterized protein YukE
MNENDNPSPGGGNLSENEYVKELFALLKENGRDTKALTALLGHVSEMERLAKRTEDMIAGMKEQLEEIKGAQNSLLRTALGKAIKKFENLLADIKETLVGLKEAIIGGCKNAAAAFKEKGAVALDDIASFFELKAGLSALEKSAAEGVKSCDRSLTKITMFANEYQSANLALKNMARMIMGEKPLSEKKELGKFAKAVSAPFKAQKTVMRQIGDLASLSIKHLEKLEATARPETPSLQERLDAAKKKVAETRDKRETPAPKREKTSVSER